MFDPTITQIRQDYHRAAILLCVSARKMAEASERVEALELQHIPENDERLFAKQNKHGKIELQSEVLTYLADSAELYGSWIERGGAAKAIQNARDIQAVTEQISLQAAALHDHFPEFVEKLKAKGIDATAEIDAIEKVNKEWSVSLSRALEILESYSKRAQAPEYKKWSGQVRNNISELGEWGAKI